jgi:ribosomal protein S18 acetylase RimI-like enzyme
MLRQFDADEFEKQKEVMLRISERWAQDQISAEEMLERIAAPFKNGNLEIQGFYRETDDALLGVLFLGHSSNRITWLHAEEELIADDEELANVESTMLDFGVEKLGMNGRPIGIGGPYLNERLVSLIISRGFEVYDRAGMVIDRDALLSIEDPPLANGLSFMSYESEKRDELAKLVYDSNIGNIDVNVFPEFFRTEEDCMTLIERIEDNVYGVFDAKSSTVLSNSGGIIGVCFITVREDSGYIPEIAIAPEHRRKGLGYAIALHALKQTAKSNEEVAYLRLDVTLKNPALNLYKKLGFKTEREYSVYKHPGKGN